MSTRRSAQLAYTLFVIAFGVVALEACDEGRFGRDCALSCHCEDPKQCDAGHCSGPTPCQSVWAGPTCQIQLENIAIGKTAEGAPLKKPIYSANLAVDGNLTTYTWLQNSAENISVYWMVDLEQVFTVHTINVAFYDPVNASDTERVKKRRPGFSVLVKQSIDEDGELCFQDASTETSPAAYHSLTNCTFKGQFIYLENSRNTTDRVTGWSTLPNLEVAEVEVLVDTGCSNGTYGDQCDKQCGHCVDIQCDRQTGACQGCSNGTYGDQCDKQCGHCVDIQCDRQTGACQGSCEDGYYGNNCNMTCPPPCIKCTKTGVCDGCRNDSYQGDFCNETCMPGCANKCFQNGTCTNACQDGLYGDMCEKACTSCHLNVSCSCDRKEGKCICGCMDTATYGVFCNETCSRIHDHCTQCEGSIENGVCLSCNSSNYGDQCENTCPENCLQCVSEQECTECKPGHSGLTCKETCKSDLCIKCNNTGDCLECIPGMKGSNCSEFCKPECATCDAIGDKCSSCVNRYYLNQEKGLCLSCTLLIKECVTCTNSDNCTQCNDGYYGHRCDTCPSNCDTCFDKTICDKCTGGWSGTQCLCSDKCNKADNSGNISSWCEEDTGECLRGCKDGFFGSDCKAKCTENCSICLQDDGRCRQCSNGRYGSFCEYKCGNCMDNNCNIDTGECPEKCMDGYHGKFCNLTCNSQCDQSKCEKITGNCTSCPPGLFGSHCELQCSYNCSDTCDQYTGDCIGCKDKRYGPKCMQVCENCKSCNQTGLCDYCDQRFYGDFCNKSCPANCGPLIPTVKHSPTECNKIDGTCMFCKPGYFLNNCTKECSSHCLPSSLGLGVCEMSNGACFKCISGFHGSHCLDRCSENCASDENKGGSSGTCQQWSGNCTNGCVNGWHDTDCSRPCNVTCNQGRCDKLTAACLGCVDGYKGVYCEEKKPEDGAPILVIIIICVAILAVVFIVIGVIFMLRNRKKRNEDDIHLPTVRKSPKKEIDRNSIVYTNLNGNSQSPPIPQRNVAPNGEMAVENGESVPLMFDKISDPSVEPDSATYYNLNTQILISTFTENLQRRQLNSAIWYKEEFAVPVPVILHDMQYNRGRNPGKKNVVVHCYLLCHNQMSVYTLDQQFPRKAKLPKGLLKSCAVAKRPENKGKCRYQMLYPYDDCRVILEPEANANSDFINASYVNGYKKPQAFIASQGPVDVNINDFWRMIFQQDCGKIVMLTKLFEDCKLKCVCYWPEMGEREEYGNYAVTMVSETVYPDYVLRQLEAENMETKEAKEFKQFHFMSWPDCGVPESPSNMLNFRNKVMESDHTLPNGPILVHCSAGIGRTGTFIALDYLLRQAQEEKLIDVFRTITVMRYQRTNFIQTDVQYEFLHHAISEALITSTMEVSQQDFPAYYQSLLDVDDNTGKTKLEEQFELLNNMSPKANATVCTSGNADENKTKNRYSNILPVDTYRAYLSTPVKGSNEYINAVFLPTCSSKTGFLLTQMPLPQTVTDFWRLVYDQHVTHVVMMNNLNDDDDDEDVGEYWPSDDCTYGPFKIELLSCENNHDFSIMNMQLTYSSTSRSKTMSVRQFRYEGWPDDRNVPQDPKCFIDFICQVSNSYRTSTSQADEPIISHCMNGAERSGLYCVLSVIMERLQSDKRLNIPQIILQLRSRRPQLIPTLEQFNFCYNAVSEYLNALEDSQIYSNVL